MDKNQRLIRLSESDRSDFGRVDFELQADQQKVFSAIWALEGQVNGGGFVGYVGSHDGETANDAATALRAIGANRSAEIVERALSMISTQPLPSGRPERVLLVESLDASTVSQLDSLDAEFYSYPDNLTELLFAYVAAHPAVFGPL